MPDVLTLKANIKDVCSIHANGKLVLKKANGKFSYIEIAKTLGMNSSTVSTILNKAAHFELVDKIKPGLYKRQKVITSSFIDSVLNGKSNQVLNEKVIGIRKYKKIVNVQKIKGQIREYFLNNFYVINHPFNEERKDKVSPEMISNAFNLLIKNLDVDLGVHQLDGLSARFYNSCSEFFSSNTVRKGDSYSGFCSLLKCFEPYLKKIAAIRTNDPSVAISGSFNEETAKKAMAFTANLKTRGTDYWKEKPFSEACLRFIYPFRHIEAHEARDYHFYEMHKIIFYMFCAIIYLNLN